MKILALSAGMAAASMMIAQAQAAGSGTPSSSLWPTAQDRAICDPIFSRLEQSERGMTLAQADLPEPAAEGEVNQTKQTPSEEDLTRELSAMLQACSYDGKAITVEAKAMTGATEAEGAAAVAKIMRFTGLPQNFTIMESDVPNAAAMIVMDTDGLPKRVIAYNRQFMSDVASATGTGDWPGTSILAHEIGHHLSGHTLMPGGSQPPIELEADKFSGFVLFKMGASLPEAEKAIATLIPEADGPTHPGRQKRLKAVQAGWQQSCEQQQDECGSETVVAAAEPQSPPPAARTTSAPAMPSASSPAPTAQQPTSTETAAAPMPHIPGPLDIEMPNPNGPKQIGPAVTDQIPVLSASATPSKFDRFVYDDVGVFDPDVREKLQTIAYQFAAASNVEVVTVVTKDLKGLDPDRYALDFMRQMRVGKMDVGNGAVLVVAPNEKKVGVALGPGLRVLFDDDESPKRRLEDFLEIVAGGAEPQRVSSTIAGSAYRVMSQAKLMQWVVRYPSFEAYHAADRRIMEERRTATTPYDPSKDPVANALLRLDATIVSKSPDMNDRNLMVNEPRSRHVGPAMQVRTADGRDIVLYVNPSVSELMPVALDEGKRYAFVARDTILGTGAPQLDLISYDLLE
jgi:hypothetical protein